MTPSPRLWLATSALAALAIPSVAALAQRQAPAFRDLNHNGRMDPYENARLGVEPRIADLLARMTVEEKVGTLLHGTLPAVDSPIGASTRGYDLTAIQALIDRRKITSMLSRLAMPPARLAAQNNAVQRLAEQSRLGIPVTISTDPRNHFSAVAGAGVAAAGFSQWPEPLGFAALGDAALVRRFGAIAAREYRAVGLHMALSPQADLATEPRWPRGSGTFGDDPTKVSALAGAYVEGFQGSATGLTRSGVATVVKHWAGYGAAPQGFDGHSHYGRFVTLTNATFAQHVRAFRGALAARSAGVMPTYSIVTGVKIDGKPLEPVGAGFSRTLLHDLLRGREGFDGLILSDWGIVNDCPAACAAPTAERPQTPREIGMPWGVETLTAKQRIAKGVNAGIDQFGGLDDPAAVLATVRAGAIAANRLDESVRRVLRIKFQLGLFDDPYVDEAAAARIVGTRAALDEGERAQARAQVLLENGRSLIPFNAARRRAWLYGLDPADARSAGFTVVGDPAQADVAVLRLSAPSEKLHPQFFFGAMQNEGRLEFRDGDLGYEALKRVAGRMPVIVAIDLDRPAVLTNVRDKATALIGVFGAGDRAIFDVVTGRVRAEGRLPIELPRTMANVQHQRSDTPADSADPLYPRGAGLPRR